MLAFALVGCGPNVNGLPVSTDTIPPPPPECTFSTLRGVWQDSNQGRLWVDHNCKITMTRCELQGQLLDFTRRRVSLDVTDVGPASKCLPYGYHRCKLRVEHKRFILNCGTDNRFVFNRNW